MTRKDSIALVEAAYTLDGTTDEWLARLAESADVIDDGLGVLAYRLRGGIHDIDSFASTNPQTATKEALEAAIQMLPPEYHAALFPTRAVTTLSERLDGPMENHPLYEMVLKPSGIEDAIAMACADGNDSLIVLSAPTRTRKTLSERERDRLDRIGIHIAAANRLRGRLRDEGMDHLDAVLTPDGNVVHAQGEATTSEARSELRDRARAIDRARSSVRTQDDLEALELWKGLVTGRWSLCDHFDTDGRHFLVVRENEAEFPWHSELTKRETQLLEMYGRGQTQKLIAYELGLETPAVAIGLRDLAAKLGAANLAELAAIATKLAQVRTRAGGGEG